MMELETTLLIIGGGLIFPLIATLYINLRHTVLETSEGYSKCKESLPQTYVTKHDHERDIRGIYNNIQDAKTVTNGHFKDLKDQNKKDLNILIKLIDKK